MAIIMTNLIYKTYSKLFSYPDKELIDLLLSGAISELFKILNPNDSNFNKIDKWSKSFNNKHDLLEELQVEYTRLFINTFPTLPAPMYKSFYDDNELFGRSVGELLDTYEQYGFEVSEEENELPDNLALLLEFIYRLDEEKISEEKQCDFIEKFILSWTPKLEIKINENTELDFYKVLITSLNNFIKEDVNQSKVKLERA